MELKSLSLETMLLGFIGIFLIFLFGIISIMVQRLEYVETNNVESKIGRLNDNFDISGLRIFFGHHSVGGNLIEWLEEGVESGDLPDLKILEIKEFGMTNSATLYHWKIGRNFRPESKLRAFRKIILDNPPESLDIAMMKFCFVDVTRESDPTALFEGYTSLVSELKTERPNLVLVHVTVPIESMPRTATGVVKHTLKTLLRKPGVVEDNAARHTYNELLRNRFLGREPVFDLARLECTDRYGRVAGRPKGTEMIEFMISEKTDDGGHLNEFGRRILGGELLNVLSEIAKDRS